MRSLRKNQQQLQYALQLGETPICQTDEDGNIIYNSYTDSEGNTYSYPLESGESEITYSTPKPFLANIAMSGGESEAQEYGLSISDYQAVILMERQAVPLTEGSLIWFESEPECRYSSEVEVEIENNRGEKERALTTAPIEISSDYRVIKLSDSLNFTRAILKATNK